MSRPKYYGSAADNIWSADEMASMNEAFVKAMNRAVRRGKERATVGIERAACTEKPIYIPAQSYVPSRSSFADFCEAMRDAHS